MHVSASLSRTLEEVLAPALTFSCPLPSSTMSSPRAPCGSMWDSKWMPHKHHIAKHATATPMSGWEYCRSPSCHDPQPETLRFTVAPKCSGCRLASLLEVVTQRKLSIHRPLPKRSQSDARMTLVLCSVERCVEIQAHNAMACTETLQRLKRSHSGF
jgi:hypothetical protein